MLKVLFVLLLVLLVLLVYDMFVICVITITHAVKDSPSPKGGSGTNNNSFK